VLRSDFLFGRIRNCYREEGWDESMEYGVMELIWLAVIRCHES
jgi:hypothetical protein